MLNFAGRFKFAGWIVDVNREEVSYRWLRVQYWLKSLQQKMLSSIFGHQIRIRSDISAAKFFDNQDLTTR